MTDEEQKELGLTNRQRILYEYYEDHPEELAKLAEAIRPVTEAIADIVVQVSEALKPIITALIPIIETMSVEELINDDEDDKEVENEQKRNDNVTDQNSHSR